MFGLIGLIRLIGFTWRVGLPGWEHSSGVYRAYGKRAQIGV